MSDANENINNETKSEKKKFKIKISKTLFKDLMNGDVLVRDVVQRQMKYIIVLLMLAMFYINNRFAYEAELKQLDMLNKELVDAQFRSLTVSKEIIEKGRQSQVQERLETMGSTLEESMTPVTVVEK